jgi:hypothetical protein
MKKIISLLILVLVSIFTYSQVQVVVQNGIKTETYENLDDAVTAAVAGDTLYLPGKSFYQTNRTIDKQLHWIGTGHYPDATGATAITFLNGDYFFTGTTDGSSFEGVNFMSNVSLGSSDDEATDMLFKRCKINGTLSFRAVATDYPNLNNTITECAFNVIDARFGSNCLVEKSIGQLVYRFHQSLFKHVDFLGASYGSNDFDQCISCVVENSICIDGYDFLYNAQTMHFQNCLFAFDYTFPTGTHTGQNNIVNVGYENIFTAIPDDYRYFSHNNDYHLQDGSAGIGAATDGTNIGIYGTALPYKDSAVPFYPHIINTAVDSNADPATNTLHIQFTVEGQDR